MTFVNVTENKYSVSVTEGATTVVTAKAPGPQGIQGLGISAGDKGSLTVAANLTDWTLNDSVVTNAKVSASAAIAGTKISPDFGSQNITTTGNAVFGGNLTVSGTTTTIDTTTLRVEDKNIELGKVGSPTDITADGGGITLLGDTNHTFNWINATDSWTSSEHIALPDNKKLQLGDNNFLSVYHTSTGGQQSFIETTGGLGLRIKSASLKLISAAGENYITCTANGSVELYYDNSIKFTTEGTGVKVFGMLVPSASGSHPLGIDVLRWNGLFMSGDIDLLDNNKLKFGDNDDLQLYHDGQNSNIDNSTNTLKIKSNRIRLNDFTNDHQMVHAVADGAVELYFDNVQKLRTTSSGITVSGSVTTEDMNMSNLNGTANEVDSTKGSWSIQEGADDLFIINRVSGKKYKFNLTEIS